MQEEKTMPLVDDFCKVLEKSGKTNVANQIRQRTEVFTLRNETGMPLDKCMKALELCENVNDAKEFLCLTNTAVARYKVVDGKRVAFTDEDYLNLIRKNNYMSQQENQTCPCANSAHNSRKKR